MVIWKYPIDENISGVIEFDMPRLSKILSVQTQNETLCIWVLVDSDTELKKRRFKIVTTGHDFDCRELMYIGTFQLFGGTFVGHLFEVT